MRRTTISHFSFLIQSRLSTAIKGAARPRASPFSHQKTAAKAAVFVQIVR